jgi:hypothetical protein
MNKSEARFYPTVRPADDTAVPSAFEPVLPQILPGLSRHQIYAIARAVEPEIDTHSTDSREIGARVVTQFSGPVLAGRKRRRANRLRAAGQVQLPRGMIVCLSDLLTNWRWAIRRESRGRRIAPDGPSEQSSRSIRQPPAAELRNGRDSGGGSRGIRKDRPPSS